MCSCMLSTKDISKLEEKFATKNDIVSFKDAILSEIQKMRDELVLIIGYKDQIEDHDTRIEKLERIVFPQVNQ